MENILDKGLKVEGRDGSFSRFGNCTVFLVVKHCKQFNIREWTGLWKTIAMRLRGKGIKIFCGGLTGCSEDMAKTHSRFGNYECGLFP